MELYGFFPSIYAKFGIIIEIPLSALRDKAPKVNPLKLPFASTPENPEGVQRKSPFFKDHMLLSPVEHTVPKGYGGSELGVYEPTPVFFPPTKAHIASIRVQTQDRGHGGRREVDSLMPSQIRSAGHFLHFFKQTTEKSFLNKQLFLLPNPIFNVLTKMGL